MENSRNKSHMKIFELTVLNLRLKIYLVTDCYYLCRENKGAGQLIFAFVSALPKTGLLVMKAIVAAGTDAA